MTLKDIVEKIWELAEKQPDIHTILKNNDIYELNQLKDVKYAAFCLTQLQHTQDNDFIYFNFYIYYADRLRSDKSNTLAIQSHSIQVLKNIIAGLDNIYEVNQVTYNTFNQRFESETAGAYCGFNIAVPLDSLCEENYN